MNIKCNFAEELKAKSFRRRFWLFVLIISASLTLNFAGRTYQYEQQASVYESVKLINARITEYGWTGKRMANGEYPHIGAVAVSDRTIPLGTKINIDGVWYEVKDRTAKWVHEKFGFTVDIFSHNPSGLDYKNVIIK